MHDPQVNINVVTVRANLVSVLGQVFASRFVSRLTQPICICRKCWRCGRRRIAIRW